MTSILFNLYQTKKNIKDNRNFFEKMKTTSNILKINYDLNLEGDLNNKIRNNAPKTVKVYKNGCGTARLVFLSFFLDLPKSS